jgi:polysaccharide biosynthesis protein PelG
MTGINTAIEAMTRRGTLSGIFGAYLYAAFLVAGPWIFTVLGILNLSPSICDDYCSDKTVFRSILIYNSMYALIVTTPLVFISGRYASEQVYAGRDDKVFCALIISLGTFVLLSFAIVVPFYMYATTLDTADAIGSIYNAMMIGCSWLLIPFLGATRGYNSVLIAFGLGTISMFVLGDVIHEPQATSLLLVFNCSFAITNLVLLGAIVRRFGTNIVVDPELRKRVSQKWELPIAGLAYALGLWIDKIIMWHADPPNGLLVAGALRTMPSYDAAMFWAQLSSIPIIAIFFVHVETGFTALIQRYYARIQGQASLRELNHIARNIKTHVLSSMFNLFMALGIVAAVMIILSFVFMNGLGLLPSYMGIFRVSLAAMAFYTSAMFCFNFLLLLDLRRPALLIVLTFLVLNAVITVVLLPLGPDLYGYGNLIAAAVSLLVGFSLVLRELSRLHYHAFITNNSAL